VPYTDVWTFPTVQDYKGKHICEKPAAMIEHIITASSRPGAVVLDCFAGSGSTLLAAKRLGRDFIGMEIDPYWVSEINQRLGVFEARDHSLEDRVTWLETQIKAQGNQIKKLQAKQLSLFA
jgi:DNA modification methylase